MNHPIHSVVSAKVAGPFTLELAFEDGLVRTINLEAVLRGEIYGPLREQSIFEQVRVDPEIRTIVWPNGADFDPSTLHDWDFHGPLLAAQARNWPA